MFLIEVLIKYHYERFNFCEQVSLDFEGLRQAIVASQRVEALKKTFGIGDGGQSYPEEEVYIKGEYGRNVSLI